MAQAAAVRVQKVFRRRMFRRYTWAQVFLRRPAHIAQLYARIQPDPVKPHSLVRLADVLPDGGGDCADLDGPWHVHDFDRQTWQATQLTLQQPVGAAAPVKAAAPPGKAPYGITDPSSTRMVSTILLRNLLQELQLPITGAETDAAVSDMERMLQGNFEEEEYRKSAVTPWGFRNAYGGKLSYNDFAAWWDRHLPFDPWAQDTILRMIRCARRVHVMEVQAYQLARGRADADGREGKDETFLTATLLPSP